MRKNSLWLLAGPSAALRTGLLLLSGLAALTLACASPEAQEVEIPVVFENGALSPETIRVTQDDLITLKVQSDAAGTLHLHGYDLSQDVAPGETADFMFAADATGRYKVAFHYPGAGGAGHHGTGGSSGGGGHSPAESEIPMNIDIGVEPDKLGGVNVEIITDGFRFAPEEVNQENTPGAGHAHIYVDGVKLNRVYGQHYHLEGLELGPREISVVLNDNQHGELMMDGQPLEAKTTFQAVELGYMVNPDPQPVEAKSAMSLEVMAHPDALGGYNLQVIPAGFRFAGSKAGAAHVAGEGHAYVSIDGEHHRRLYSDWLKMPALEPGMREITVALANNAYQPYHWQGRPVAATITVHAEPPAEDTGGHDHGGSSSGQETEVDVGYLEVLPR